MQDFVLPGSRLETLQIPGADLHPDQAQDRAADGGTHAPDLTVAAFVDADFEPGGRATGARTRWRIPIRHRRRTGDARRQGSGRSVFQHHPGTKARQGFRRRLTLDEHAIGLGEAAAGAADASLQVTAVGQQQQAFRVPVEAAGWIDVGNLEQGLQGRPGVLGGELRQNPVRLPESDQPRQVASPGRARRPLRRPACASCVAGKGVARIGSGDDAARSEQRGRQEGTGTTRLRQDGPG